MTETETTIDREDISRFDAVAERWWDMNGPMRPLHLFTPVRIDYLLKAARTRNHAGLKGLKVLDIGCGGGLLAEPVARLGGRVTAIDASSGAIDAAKRHAELNELEITYLNCASEDLASDKAYQGQFDLVYSSEVIEHVSDRRRFLADIEALMADEGRFMLTTINQSLPALFTVKLAAEYLLRVIPKGTHQYDKFITPEVLRSECAEAGLVTEDVTGFTPTLSGGFRMSSVTAVNYGIFGGRWR